MYFQLTHYLPSSPFLLLTKVTLEPTPLASPLPFAGIWDVCYSLDGGATYTKTTTLEVVAARSDCYTSLSPSTALAGTNVTFTSVNTCDVPGALIALTAVPGTLGAARDGPALFFEDRFFFISCPPPPPLPPLFAPFGYALQQR